MTLIDCRKLIKHFLHFFPILSFTICLAQQPEQPPQDYERGKILTSQENGILSTEEIRSRMNELPHVRTIFNPVRFFAITYTTLLHNKPVQASALILMPENIDTARLLTYLHGTEIPSKLLGVDHVTPSTYKGQMDSHRDVRNIGLGFASAGYVVLIPDYIGYGSSYGQDHPYMNYSEMFISNLDALRAAREFIRKNGKIYDNNLFITGWSQGGGACLSMHRFIEEKHSTEFRVVASSGLAGPYNFYRFAMEKIQWPNKEVAIMPLLSWSIYSLNKFSTINRNTSRIFKKPVINQMLLLLKKEKKPSQIFSAGFLRGLTRGTDKQFLTAMKDNSFHAGWRPHAPVFLHHGDADPIVPYFNSVDAKNSLQAAGGRVELFTYTGGKHDTDLGNFLENTLIAFENLK